jgi:cytochrome c556
MRSHFFWTFLFAGVLALAGSVGSAGMAAEDPVNLIKYRQATMRAIGAHMGMIAAPLSGEVGFTDEIAGHARAINQLSKNLTRLFPEGTGPEAGETRALPAIWQKWGEFAAVIQALEAESGKLAEVAETGDLAAIGQQVGVLGNNGCGACHKPFRAEKN